MKHRNAEANVFVPPIHAMASAALALMFFVCSTAMASDPTKQFELNLGVGYTSTQRLGNAPPLVVEGATFELGAKYYLSSSLLLTAAVGFDLHPDYPTLKRNYDFDVEGASDWVAGPTIQRFYYTTVAAELGYIVDTPTLMPYLAAGILGIRRDQYSDGVHDATYDVGIRLTLAADYPLTDHWTIGGAFHYDILLTTSSGYRGRLGILARTGLAFSLMN